MCVNVDTRTKMVRYCYLLPILEYITKIFYTESINSHEHNPRMTPTKRMITMMVSFVCPSTKNHNSILKDTSTKPQR